MNMHAIISRVPNWGITNHKDVEQPDETNQTSRVKQFLANNCTTSNAGYTIGNKLSSSKHRNISDNVNSTGWYNINKYDIIDNAGYIMHELYVIGNLVMEIDYQR